MNVYHRAEAFMGQWLRGSTCHHHKRTIHYLDGDYVLLKHWGHSAYIGRFSGTSWCNTYYALYDMRDPNIDCLGKHRLWYVEGRWLKRHEDELKQVINDLQNQNNR